jgi:hypothetical protein
MKRQVRDRIEKLELVALNRSPRHRLDRDEYVQAVKEVALAGTESLAAHAVAVLELHGPEKPVISPTWVFASTKRFTRAASSDTKSRRFSECSGSETRCWTGSAGVGIARRRRVPTVNRDRHTTAKRGDRNAPLEAGATSPELVAPRRCNAGLRHL